MYKFTVTGVPKGKARPRITSRGNFTPQDTKDYQSLIGFRFIQEFGKIEPLQGPLYVCIFAHLPIPESYSKKRKFELEGKFCTVKPDADNIAKSVCDALNNIAYKDDNQIVELSVYKFYSSEPRVEILIKCL